MADEFASKYTLANVPHDAAVYEAEAFLKWLKQLESSSLKPSMAVAVMVAILLAQRRGDAAANLFKDITLSQSDDQIKQLFVDVREAVTLVSPFVGLPNTMPANFGMIAVLRGRAIESVDSISRPKFTEADYAKIGRNTNQAIYRGVGNEEVGQMLEQLMPDLTTYNTVGVFGYLCGSSPVFALKEVEIIIVSAIIGLGATRQARSHTKAAMQLGVSIEILSAISAVAQDIARWNKALLPEALDIVHLRLDLLQELDKFGVAFL